MVTSVYGVELMKDVEFRMAVIDQHRDRSKTTLQLLQNNYPHFLTSFDTDSLVVKDSEWEAFCSKFDSLMNIFAPLDISDPFFVDSVDTRIFNILMFISREESDSTKSAIIKSVLKEVKIKKQKFSLSSLFKEHKNVLVQQQNEGVTPKSIATSILIRMIRKYLIDGDIPRLVVKEAFAKQQSVAQLANVTTKLNGKITENNFEILGNVLTDGGVSVTERGLVWAKYHNPTVDDNRIVVGEGIGEFTSSLQITGDSNYYVRAFAENSAGTAYGNSIVLNSNGLVGLDKFISGNFEFVIYPNPAKNEVHVKFDIKNPEKIAIAIIDLSGRIVFEKQIEDAQTGTNSITVNISGLQNGMYICKINGNGTQLHSEKLFVVH